MSQSERQTDTPTDVRAIDDLSTLATTVNTSAIGTQPEDHSYVITIAVDRGAGHAPFVLRRGIDTEQEAQDLYAKVEASLDMGTAYAYRAELRASLTDRVLAHMTA